jgi:hypothetical protein
MEDEVWSYEDSRAADLSAYAPNHPWRVGMEFLARLKQLDSDPTAIEDLEYLSTPESRWGDFKGAADMVAAWGDWGVGTRVAVHPDAPDVAYLAIRPKIRKAHQVEDAAATDLGQLGAISFVWRPEHGLWLVHGIGEPLEPDEMPRSSPGNAPRVDLWAG